MKKFSEWYNRQDRSNQIILLLFICLEILAGVMAIAVGAVYMAVATLIKLQ